MSIVKTYSLNPIARVLIAVAILLLLSLPVMALEGTIKYVSGEWTPANNPYFFDDTLVIPPDEELIIQAGTEVVLDSYIPIEVYGTLRINGVWGNPVILRGSLTGEEWSGINFQPGSSSFSMVKFTNISEAYNGITLNQSDLSEIAYCNISARVNGIYIQDASPFIHNNTITVSDDRGNTNIYGININRGPGKVLPSPIILDNPMIHVTSVAGQNAYGIHIRESAPELIEGNWIEVASNKLYACGIYTKDCDQMTVRRNIIRSWAIETAYGVLGDGQRKLKLINNTVVLNGSINQGTGLLFINGGAGDCVVTSNIVIGNGNSIGIASRGQIDPVGSGWNDFCNHSQNFGGDWRGNNDISKEPMFVTTALGHPDGYKLVYPDTCIDAGNPDVKYLDPDSTRADIGRWFFDQTGINHAQPVISPNTVEMVSAYPNPFNNTTTFNLSLATSGSTRLAVFDLSGRLVDQQELGWLDPGNHKVAWNGAGKPSGVYLAVMEHNGSRSVVRIVLLP